MSDTRELATWIYQSVSSNCSSIENIEKKIIEFVSVDRELLHRAYKSWKQGETKGMAWADLEEVFLEYERIHPDRKEPI